MKKKGYNLKQLCKDNSGSAMVMTLIVGMVVMAFCLSLLLVAFTLFSQMNHNTIQFQCKTLAQSYLESLKTDFCNPDSDLIKYLSSKMEAPEEGNEIWIAQNLPESELEELKQNGLKPYKDLYLQVDASGYTMDICMTYERTQATAEEDSENESDDEIEEVNSNSNTNSNANTNSNTNTDSNTNTNEPQTNGGTASQVPVHSSSGIAYERIIHVKLTCVRGTDTSSNDNYTMEADYKMP